MRKSSIILIFFALALLVLIFNKKNPIANKTTPPMKSDSQTQKIDQIDTETTSAQFTAHSTQEFRPDNPNSIVELAIPNIKITPLKGKEPPKPFAGIELLNKNDNQARAQFGIKRGETLLAQIEIRNLTTGQVLMTTTIDDQTLYTAGDGDLIRGYPGSFFVDQEYNVPFKVKVPADYTQFLPPELKEKIPSGTEVVLIVTPYEVLE